MTWIHAVKRQGVVAVLSLGLAIPAIGLASGALADSQGRGAANAASAQAGSQGNAGANGHNGNGNAGNNGNAASNGNNGNGNGAKAQAQGTSNTEAAGVAQANGNGNGGAGGNASASNGNGSVKTVDAPAGCPNSFHNSDTGHGANVSGAYDSTCDGSPSLNGNGNGNAGGKPCAGCVGNADDKNPPGQAPDGSDHNKGYECDSNHGVGRTNPAHTGCTPGTPTEPKVCPDGSPMTDRNHDGKVNGADCQKDEKVCPDGTPMTDRNGDGKVNGADCQKDE